MRVWVTSRNSEGVMLHVERPEEWCEFGYGGYYSTESNVRLCRKYVKRLIKVLPRNGSKQIVEVELSAKVVNKGEASDKRRRGVRGVGKVKKEKE